MERNGCALESVRMSSIESRWNARRSSYGFALFVGFARFRFLQESLFPSDRRSRWHLAQSIRPHLTSAASMQTDASTPSTPRPRRPWYRPSLTTQIMLGLILGALIGYLRPNWGNALYFLRDIFLNLIKSIIGPLVFSTLVVGIAGGGELKKVGRMGLKALIYFEVVTTVALFIGLAVVNLTKPGVGVPLVAT